MEKRIIDHYKGFLLVANLTEGVVWGNGIMSVGHPLTSVEGYGLQDVIQKLKLEIDSPQFQDILKQIQDKLKADLIEKHGNFLKRQGISAEGMSVHDISQVYNKRHRATGCYECKSRVDNEINLECRRCSWIICEDCGACGCGHPEYGKKIINRVESNQKNKLAKERVQGNSISRTFSDYDAAIAYARQHPGSILKRLSSEGGWIVTNKSQV